MDDFINEIAGSIPYKKGYEGPYKAKDFFKLTKQALKDSLSPVYETIRGAANEGCDSVDVKDSLSEDQVWILEKYNFSVEEFDEDDEEYKNGFRFNISWCIDEEDE
jgi:hypothetical protein